MNERQAFQAKQKAAGSSNTMDLISISIRNYHKMKLTECGF